MDRSQYDAWKEKSFKEVKFLFSGCSYTWGDELPNYLCERYSKIVSDHYQEKSINISECGISNDTIVRRTIDWLENVSADVVVIQFTVQQRLELFNEKGDIVNSTPQSIKTKQQEVYYKDVYTDQVGAENLWQNVFLWDSYCKEKGQKYVSLLADHYDNAIRFPDRLYEHGFGNYRKLCRDCMPSMINNGILGLMKQYPQHYVGGVCGGHPSVKGHIKMADKVVELIDAI